jgi:HD-GYP domain-containing protein (c-di-GMP phosphodiesterase class II)
LRGEAIPLTARLFAVVDVFDALCSDRPYRNACSRSEVLAYFDEQIGEHFDPQIAKVFMELAHQEKWVSVVK